jgi:hypothetical protein
MKIIRVCALAILFCSPAVGATPSAFYPPKLLERIRANAEKDDWGRDIKKRGVAAAEPWMKMSDDELWKLVFGATIPRSWHVWSDGHCPACKKPVPMYDWKIDALKQPWKVRCPECKELFPKNHFKAFYDSGLDEHGIFDPKKADRSLLVNAEHAEASDPKQKFGVDDGLGYVEGEKRWRFIQAYLVYGQWKQVVEGGVKALSTAYVLTGDKAYAHKAGVLLDRIADVYPTFDFKTQGILYERNHSDGYVSVWHDSTIETRELALSYDAVKDAIATDEELAKFLGEKAKQFKPPLPKTSPADVVANIETRILRDALAHQEKIYSNFPQQQLTTAVIQTALGWPGNREEVLKTLDPVIEQSTAVDGVTGEKGLAGYSAYAAQQIAGFMGYYARMDDAFLAEMIKRHPRLPQMWRFFIDTWIAQDYYPSIGDTGHFAGRHPTYAGMMLSKDHAVGSVGHYNAVLTPSSYTFLWQLYEATKDPAFAQVLLHANDGKPDGLPYDLFAADAAGLRHELASVIEKNGAELKLASVNKSQWHLAILRSGTGDDRRALWLDYDTWGGHGHADGMNIGFVAKGLDLMPDLGYPPVQFGGWESPRASWYKSAWAHNTVVVDGGEQAWESAPGTTKLWAAGDGGVQAVTASMPSLNGGRKFDRTVALIDVGERDAYVLDVFRVAGGKSHSKFFMSQFARATPANELAMQPAPAAEFAHPQMRNWTKAKKPVAGWSVDFALTDKYKLLEPRQSPVRVRYRDFTIDADAYLGEAWVVAGIYNSNEEAWVPRVMTRRTSVGAGTTFVSVIEPFGPGDPVIRSAKRIGATTKPSADESVCVEVQLADGRSDLLVSNDTLAASIEVPELKLSTDARFAVVRRDAAGKPESIAIAGGKSMSVGDAKLELKDAGEFIQVRLSDGRVMAGDASRVVK